MPIKRIAISKNAAKLNLNASLAESDDSRFHRLSAAALTGLMEEVCVAAMSEDIGAGKYAVTNVMHFRNLAPTRSKGGIRSTATFRMFDGDLYWFDVVVTGEDGPVATGSHGLSIVDRRERDV